MKCAHCGLTATEDLSLCSFCRLYFCRGHHRPSQHQCPRLKQISKALLARFERPFVGNGRGYP